MWAAEGGGCPICVFSFFLLQNIYIDSVLLCVFTVPHCVFSYYIHSKSNMGEGAGQKSFMLDLNTRIWGRRQAIAATQAPAPTQTSSQSFSHYQLSIQTSVPCHLCSPACSSHHDCHGQSQGQGQDWSCCCHDCCCVVGPGPE